MFLVVFRFSWCNYSLIILYDGKTELESILEENFLKRHETAVVDVFSGKVSISDSRGYFFNPFFTDGTQESHLLIFTTCREIYISAIFCYPEEFLPV